MEWCDHMESWMRVWSDMKESSHETETLEKVPLTDAARLAHVRSMVLSWAPASPLWVGICGTERRVYICIAKYSSTQSAQWDFIQPMAL